MNYANFVSYGIPVLVNDIVALISFATILILSHLGLMGRGDSFIISFIFLLNPYPIFFVGIPIFPGFAITMLSFLYPLYIIFRNVYVNAKNIEIFKNLTERSGKISKLYYFLFGETMRKEEFEKKKFYFPLVSSGMKRLHANMELDPLSPEKYKIEGKYLIASFGIPMAFAIFIGYILFLVSLLLGFSRPFF
ncbi:MAG: hypothetical protein C0179_00425 [Fervidicoccus sp.]|nr:MAG: hypothetical protein C0179_00425 [Fervidicoccus sp.]